MLKKNMKKSKKYNAQRESFLEVLRKRIELEKAQGKDAKNLIEMQAYLNGKMTFKKLMGGN